MKICILLFSDIRSRICDASGNVLLQYNQIIMHKWHEDSFVVVRIFMAYEIPFYLYLNNSRVVFQKGIS